MATYREIADDLREQINSGELPPGSKLPSVKELAEQYGCAKTTVNQAVADLARAGLVRTQVGRAGTIVLPHPTRRRIRRGQTVTRGPGGYVFPAAASPDERWMTHGTPYRSSEPAPAYVAEAFGVEAGANVLRRRRVTSPEGEPPFQVVDTWISPDAVTDAPQVAEPSTGPGGYLDRLEEVGHGPLSWVETTRARMPSSEEARLLEIPEALPIFEMTIVGTSASTRRPIEVTTRVIPADRVELVSELRRATSARWPVTPIPG